jgi:[acyl-carrier-protein] S-malonyltransferase
VISNVDASYHGNPASIRAALVRQLTQPVQWQQCVERMAADGADRFVEFGPGRVLTGLMRKIDRTLEAVNISTADAVAAGLGLTATT